MPVEAAFTRFFAYVVARIVRRRSYPGYVDLVNPNMVRELGPTMTWSMWVAVVVVVIGLAGLVSCFWDILRKPPHPPL